MPMPNHPLALSRQLTQTQIKDRYRSCKDPVERSHWQALWLLSRPNDPLTAEKAASVIGCSAGWVRTLVRRYNSRGPLGLVDGRKKNGRKPILTAARRRTLEKALADRPVDGGLWNGPKVAVWMSATLGRKVSAVTGWHYLRRLDFTPQMPRPCNAKAASEAERDAFKKNSARR